MDIYCTKCGEPWGIDCLHDAAEYGITVQRGRIVRCGGCDSLAPDAPRSQRAAAADALHDLMPDDPDGVAAMLDDADAWGLL